MLHRFALGVLVSCIACTAPARAGASEAVPVFVGGGDVGVLYEGAGYARIVFRRIPAPSAPVR